MKDIQIFDKKTRIILILLIVLLVILVLAIQPLIAFSVWFRWWREHDPDNKYNCVSLVNLAYFHSNILLYDIINLFTTRNKKFDQKWWVYFITGMMMGQAVDIVPGGLCTPKTLCESLVPDTFPLYNYYESASDAKAGRSTSVWPTTMGVPNTNTRDDKGKMNAVTSDTRGYGWKEALMTWGDITYDPKQKDATLRYQYDTDKWFANPDNFLGKWGIPPDSGAVVGFITGLSESPIDNETTWQASIPPLLGEISGFSAGGWLGFLQVNGDFGGRGIAEANRILYANMPRPSVPNSVKKQQDKAKSCNVASLASGALGTGMGGAFAGGALAAGLGCAATGWFTLGLSCAAFAAVAGGAIGAAAGAGLSAASQKCI